MIYETLLHLLYLLPPSYPSHTPYPFPLLLLQTTVTIDNFPDLVTPLYSSSSSLTLPYSEFNRDLTLYLLRVRYCSWYISSKSSATAPYLFANIYGEMSRPLCYWSPPLLPPPPHLLPFLSGLVPPSSLIHTATTLPDHCNILGSKYVVSPPPGGLYERGESRQ